MWPPQNVQSERKKSKYWAYQTNEGAIHVVRACKSKQQLKGEREAIKRLETFKAMTPVIETYTRTLVLEYADQYFRELAKEVT